MSWLPDYKYRTSLSVDGSGSILTTSDVAVTIPPAWPEFWDAIQSTGYDIRVTTASGVAVPFKRVSFTYASKALVLAMDDVAIVASTHTALWLYWGYAGAADGVTSFSPSSPLDAYVTVELGGPVRVVAAEEPSGATKPQQVLVKKPTEELDVYVDFGPQLVLRARPYANSRALEEIAHVIACEVHEGGAAQAGMVTAASHRIMARGMVKMRIKAGTTAHDYTGVCRVSTTTGRILEARYLLRVRTPVE